MNLVGRLARALQDHPLFMPLIKGALVEKTVRGEIEKVACQIRPDALVLGETNVLIDLKTCDDLTWFESDARRFGYEYQMSFYKSILLQYLPKITCVLIAVEKKEPYRVGVWRVGESVLKRAEDTNKTAIRKLIECGQTGIWPTGYEEIREWEY